MAKMIEALPLVASNDKKGKAKGKVKGNSNAVEGGEMVLGLNTLGMTHLHRAGLAGLAMTLGAFDAQIDPATRHLKELGDWEVSETSVRLTWKGKSEEFFWELLKASFRLTEDGLIYLPALGNPDDNREQAVLLHEAILGTLLQHNQTRKPLLHATVSEARRSRSPEGRVDDVQAEPDGGQTEPAESLLAEDPPDSKQVKPKAKRRSRTVEIDGTTQIVTYLPLSSYSHQNFKLSAESAVKIVGWLYPGGIVRHQANTSETSLTESPERALALLFAPIGSIYFQVHKKNRPHTILPDWCIAIPEITNLLDYAESRLQFFRGGVERLHVSGSAEAAARVLTEIKGSQITGSLGISRCFVVAFSGNVPWFPNQKARIDLFTVNDVRPETLNPYVYASHVLKARRLIRQVDEPENEDGQKKRGAKKRPAATKKPSDGPQSSFWWDAPQLLDHVARNALLHKPWWNDFTDFWQRLREAQSGKNRDKALYFEKEALIQMVRNPQVMPDGPETRIVRACQTAWRRRMGELGERARRQGTDFGSLVNAEFERTRVSFVGCKSAAMLRQRLTDFWSRAGGPLPELQDGWAEIIPFLGPRWREARDLALLALASYKRPDEADQPENQVIESGAEE